MGIVVQSIVEDSNEDRHVETASKERLRAQKPELLEKDLAWPILSSPTAVLQLSVSDGRRSFKWLPIFRKLLSRLVLSAVRCLAIGRYFEKLSETATLHNLLFGVNCFNWLRGNSRSTRWESVLRSIVPESTSKREARENGVSEAVRRTCRRDLLHQGFHLAYFLVPDRLRAIEILISAFEKQQSRSFRENKRFYWRDKHPAHSVRSVTRSDSDVLQWLIMSEADQYELLQERTGQPAPREMVVRFIKHVVGITSAMSSFYVNVGINKLLHSYSTEEAQSAYEEISGRLLSQDEYRRTKGVLMRRLVDRFGDWLTTERGSRGEIRFEVYKDQSPLSGLVREALEKFTPWSTDKSCPSSSKSDFSRYLTKGDQNEVEIRCCHILIEPRCHERLMEKISRDRPFERLAIPILRRDDQQIDGNFGAGEDPGRLTEQEFELIEAQLRERQQRRKEMLPSFIRVFLDGIECAQMVLNQEATSDIHAEEGARRIEIRGVDSEGEVLLGIHLLKYMDLGLAADKACISLTKGKIELTVVPRSRHSAEVRQARIRFQYNESARYVPFMSFRRSLTRALSSWQYVTALSATLIVVISLVGFLARRTDLRPGVSDPNPRLQRQNERSISSATSERYRLTADDRLLRGNSSGEAPLIQVPTSAKLITLELPLSRVVNNKERFRIELTELERSRPSLIFDSLVPVRTSDGNVLEAPVPTRFLTEGRYYSLHVVSLAPRGGFESSFSFGVADRH